MALAVDDGEAALQGDLVTAERTRLMAAEVGGWAGVGAGWRPESSTAMDSASDAGVGGGVAEELEGERGWRRRASR